MSGIDMPAAASISVSASINGSRSREDSRRPMVDLPAPIMPTSTTERIPSAAVISASKDAVGLAGETASGIKLGSIASRNALWANLDYRLGRCCQRLLQRTGEHVGSQPALSRRFNG